METVIYLAGQICRNGDSYMWRDMVSASLSGINNIRVINPCANTFSRHALKEANANDKNIGDIICGTIPAACLAPKDKSYIEQSDIIIANLNPYCKDIPFVGTLFELAWAYDDTSKIVIGVMREQMKDNIMRKHPFIESAVNTWVHTPEEAVNLIKGIYK